MIAAFKALVNQRQRMPGAAGRNAETKVTGVQNSEDCQGARLENQFCVDTAATEHHRRILAFNHISRHDMLSNFSDQRLDCVMSSGIGSG